MDPLSGKGEQGHLLDQIVGRTNRRRALLVNVTVTTGPLFIPDLKLFQFVLFASLRPSCPAPSTALQKRTNASPMPSSSSEFNETSLDYK